MLSPVVPALARLLISHLFIQELYYNFCNTIVLDADALNALSLIEHDWNRHAGERILTPHPGEFSRITGRTISEIQANRLSLATDFAAANNLTLLLKGKETIITQPENYAVNHTGNSGMATGGSGDVLTGIVASLIGQTCLSF